MDLGLCTWAEVECYLERSRTVIVPIGSTEQHGPNGLLGTDAICAEAIAREVGRQSRTLVATPIGVGMAQHHLAFPGTISLRPETLMAVVADYVESLGRHGFRGFYFLNGHGGNVATVTAAFSAIYARRSFEVREQDREGADGPGGRSGDGEGEGLRLAIHNWWTGPGVRNVSRELFGAAEGSHATPSEVSVTWHLHPEAIKRVEMSPPVAPTGRIRDALDYRRQFPDGRIGSDPSLASPEAGATLFEAAVRDVLADLQSFQATL